MIIEKFEEQVVRLPDKIAVKSGNKFLTYRELDRYADAIADEILSNHQPGEAGTVQRVALLFEHGVDMIAGIISVLKADRIYVPFDVNYPIKRLAYMLEDSGSLLILTNSVNLPLAETLKEESQHSIDILNIENTRRTSPGPHQARKPGKAAGDKPAYILYTSGSTGQPKGVVQTHRNALYYVRNWVERFSITEADRMTLFSAFIHDGSVQDMFAALLSGACLYPYSIKVDTESQGIYKLLKNDGITIWHSVPSLFRYFGGTLPGTEHFNKIRWVLLGGEPIRSQDLELYKTFFPKATMANVYGQTESSVNSICEISLNNTFDDLSIGEPLDETEIILVDDDGDVIEGMGVGEIVVVSDYIALGYWQDEESSKKVFISDDEAGRLYRTGDLGRYTGRGAIKMMGRKDFQVKIRGFRIETGEIETSLLKMTGIHEAAVVLKDTGTTAPYLCGFITSDREMTVTELREFLSRELPDYMIPTTFIQLESMPYTQSRKLDRNALAKLEKKSLPVNLNYAVPQTDMEKMVAETWKEVLGLERVGIHDNLFDLGGNSFDIVEINNKLARLLKRKIPIVKLFEYTTIEALSRHLSQEESAGNLPGKVCGSIQKERKPKPGETSGKIAVIGMAGRFPGAGSIDEFWENLKNGIESISFFSEEELKASGIEEALINNPNYVKAKGMLEDIEFFDASFFSYTPHEAEVMDPQTRIFLECLWEALEHAAYNPYDFNGLIGLYAGNNSNYYWLLKTLLNGKNNSLPTFDTMLLNESFSAQVAYKLNLKGPCVSVRTACSTSLTAIHLASRGLLGGECDLALAGGASLSHPKQAGYLYQEGLLLSADGHIRAFDARAKGTIFGDGVGGVVLKRFEEALADGDYIHAVILGTAINNDGIRKVGYTAPSIEGQADVIRAAQLQAGIEPGSIGFIEAHGTGTTLGDPVEIEALKKIFTGSTKASTTVNTVKSNVGHLNAAAGVTGFIKAVLCLKNKSIPPGINFENLNPEINFAPTGLLVNPGLTAWKNDGYPLRAGVNSFGLGGTNAHAVLEEAPPEASPGKQAPARMVQLILLSARTETALEKASQNLLDYLKKNPGTRLADIAYTLQVGRKAFQHRKMLVCSTIDEAIQALSSPGPRQVRTFLAKENDRPVIFMYPGLGSQYVNMGLELYQKEPVFREEMDRCFNILKSLTGDDIKEILYPGSGPDERDESKKSNNTPQSPTNLDQVEIAQLVIFIFEYALSRLLMNWGIKPKALIGYSFGEYTAACISGVFSLEDALKLVVLRGRLIGKIPAGAMLSVPLTKNQVKPLLNDDLSIAIDNGPSCIISGARAAVDAFEKQMKEKKYICMRLPVSHGIHSGLMTPILAEFTKQVAQVTLKSPQVPYVSNVTGNWISGEEAANPSYYAKHLSSTVQFAAGMEKLLNEKSAVFIEIGPGRDLGTLVQRYMEDKPGHRVLNTVRHPGKEIPDLLFLLNKIGYLWFWGAKIDWHGFHGGEQRYRLPLPAYPFERRRFWLEGSQFKNEVKEMMMSPTLKKQDISNWFYLPWWKPSTIPARQPGHAADRHTWLIFADNSGWALQLVKQLEEEHREIIIVKTGTGWSKENDRTYTIDPGKGDHYKILLKELKEAGKSPEQVIHSWSVTGISKEEPGDEWLEKCQVLGYYSLIYFAQAIAEQIPDNEIQITVVTDNMQGIYEEDLLYPEKATLLGPVNIIPKEYLNIKCRSVDFQLPGTGTRQEQRISRQLLEEINWDTTDTVVAYRGNKRFIPSYEPVKLEQPAAAGPRFREKGVYLITGGLGGIGLLIAEYLAGLVQAKLILTGRSAFPPRQQWEEWLNVNPGNDATSKKIRKLQEIEKLGGVVSVYSADVSNLEQMEEIVRAAERQWGPVNGIIHNALQIDGGVIHAITREKTENVFATKVRGTIALDRIFKNHRLDFFMVSSSVSSIMMEIGHVAYAAASAFLDAFCQQRALNHERPAISINWSIWQEVGGALALVQEHGKTLGFSETQTQIKNGIRSGEGIEAFGRILAANPLMPQVVVSPQDLNERIKRSKTLSPRTSPSPGSLADIDLPGKRLARPELDSEYVPARNDIEQRLVEIWCKFFGLEKIGIQDDFFELGGDSLKAIILTSLIHKHLHAAVGIATIFNKSTIEALARYIENSEGKNPYSPIKPVEKKEYYMISASQKRVYILQQMDPGSTAFNMSQIVGMQGKPALAKFENVFKKLIERHGCLRTSFKMLNDEPVQQVYREVAFSLQYFEVEFLEKSTANPLTPHELMLMPGVASMVNNFIQPFDLNRAPLLRVGIIKLEETYHILMVDLHHIISDGVSQAILVQDMINLYKGEELNPLRLQYKDFSEWQGKIFNTEKIKAQEKYWLDRFKGDIPLLKIPTDYPRETFQDYEGDGLVFNIDEELTKKFKALMTEYGTTLYMTLLAVFSILLSKYANQDDIIIGSPTAGRRHADLDNVVGMFVNVLLMRSFPAPGKTFAGFLQEVKTVTLEAFENQDYQFDDLVGHLKLNRDTEKNPVYNVIFAVMNIDNPKYQFPGLNFEPYPIEKMAAKTELRLGAMETAKTIDMKLTYVKSLFKKEHIKEMAEHYIDISKQVLKNTGIKLKDIKISHHITTIKPSALRSDPDEFNF